MQSQVTLRPAGGQQPPPQQSGASPGAPVSSPALSDTRERCRLSGNGFVLPDSLEKMSDSLLCRCTASGSHKDRAAGRSGRKEEAGIEVPENCPVFVTWFVTQGLGQFLKHGRNLMTLF